MRVKNLIALLQKFPEDSHLFFERDTQHGRIMFDMEGIELKRDAKPRYNLTAQLADGETYEVQGIEETSERCIIVLS